MKYVWNSLCMKYEKKYGLYGATHNSTDLDPQKADMRQ